MTLIRLVRPQVAQTRNAQNMYYHIVGPGAYWAGKERTEINPAEQREGVRISDIPMKEPGMNQNGLKEPPDYILVHYSK